MTSTHPDRPPGVEHRETARTVGKVWFAPADAVPPPTGARWSDPADSGWAYLGEITGIQFGSEE